MKVTVFNSKSYDQAFLSQVNQDFGFELQFIETHLTEKTAALAAGCTAVCAFVSDNLGAATLRVLANQGVVLVALRCAGFNNVDLAAAKACGIRVVRVPAYSPYAVAEHTVALMLDLNRKIHRAFNRVRECNFSLEGLLGFDMHGKTAGIIGTGKIGALVAKILTGFGCQVLAFDVCPNESCLALGVRYVALPELLRQSDIISIHCPLIPQTHHLVNAETIAMMKENVMLINTSRGAVVDTPAVIEGLKSGKIGYLGLDVYEEEGDLFFEDLSCNVIQDDLFARLLTFPNVLITGHQAFFTREALENIAHTTLNNLRCFDQGLPLENEVT